MALCNLCGSVSLAAYANGEVSNYIEHLCHCIRVDGVRVAMGICCGHDVGAELAAEEDYHDGAPWSRPEDCVCKREIV